MSLHGVGEPPATQRQRVTQAIKIELFRQWQTYGNGVHMDSDTFGSIDFDALGRAVLTVMPEPSPSEGPAEPSKRVDDAIDDAIVGTSSALRVAVAQQRVGSTLLHALRDAEVALIAARRANESAW